MVAEQQVTAEMIDEAHLVNERVDEQRRVFLNSLPLGSLSVLLAYDIAENVEGEVEGEQPNPARFTSLVNPLIRAAANASGLSSSKEHGDAVSEAGGTLKVLPTYLIGRLASLSQIPE